MILVTVTSDELVYQEYWYKEEQLVEVLDALSALENREIE